MGDWSYYYLLLGSKDGFKTKEVVQVKAENKEQAMQEFKNQGYRGWWVYVTTRSIYNRLRFMYKFTDESSLDKFILDNYIGLEDPKHQEVKSLVNLLTSKSINTSYFMDELKDLNVTLDQLHVNFGIFFQRKKKAK